MDKLQPRLVMEAKLKSLPDVGARVHETMVPGSVEMVGNKIRPYLLWWSNVPRDIAAERDSTGLVDTAMVDWRCQVNCVGADPGTVFRLADQVSSALVNLPMLGGWLVPDPYALTVSSPIVDTQLSPARMYIPLSWRLVTN